MVECLHETGSLITMGLIESTPVEAIGAAETIRAGCSSVRCVFVTCCYVQDENEQC